MKIIRTVTFIFLLTTVMCFTNGFTQDLPLSIKVDGQVNDIKYSHDSTLLAVATSKELYLYNAKTLKKVKTLRGHKGSIKAVAFSEDGKSFASVDNHSLILWNPITGSIQKTIEDKWTEYWPSIVNGRSFENPILAVAFTQNDNVIVIRTAYYQFKRTVGPSERIYSNKGVSPDISHAIIGPNEVYTITTALVLSSDGEPSATGQATVSKKRSSQKIENINVTVQLPKVDKEIPTIHKDVINAIAVSSDEDILASGSSDKTIQLIDVATGAHLITLNKHEDAITALAFSPDGKTLASGSKDGTILLSNMNQLISPTHIQIKTWLKENGYKVTNISITNLDPNNHDIYLAPKSGSTAGNSKVTISNMGNHKVKVSINKIGSAIFIYGNNELQPAIQ